VITLQAKTIQREGDYLRVYNWLMVLKMFNRGGVFDVAR